MNKYINKEMNRHIYQPINESMNDWISQTIHSAGEATPLHVP